MELSCNKFKCFDDLRKWCIAILPTIFDESMSYYEQICKLAEVVQTIIDNETDWQGEIDKLQEQITNVNSALDEFKNQTGAEFEGVKNDIVTINQWIADFMQGKEEILTEILSHYFQTPLFPGLTQNGYFVIYSPDSWDEIQFGTTGYDEPLGDDGQFGHLTLSY